MPWVYDYNIVTSTIPKTQFHKKKFHNINILIWVIHYIIKKDPHSLQRVNRNEQVEHYLTKNGIFTK